MPQNPNAHRHVRSHEEWFYDAGDTTGIFALPFGDGPVRDLDHEAGLRDVLDPNYPIRTLQDDPSYQDGYAQLRTREIDRYPQFELGIVFTDGADADGLRSVVQEAQMVAYSTWRAVEAQLAPDAAARAANYSGGLMSALARFDGPILDVNPERNASGSLVNPTDRLVEGMADEVHVVAMQYGTNHKRFEASDLAHLNAELCRALGSFSVQMHGALRENPKITTGILIVTEEYSDILRRFRTQNAPEDLITPIQWNGVDLDNERNMSTRGIFEAGRIRGLFKPHER